MIYIAGRALDLEPREAHDLVARRAPHRLLARIGALRPRPQMSGAIDLDDELDVVPHAVGLLPRDVDVDERFVDTRILDQREERVLERAPRPGAPGGVQFERPLQHADVVPPVRQRHHPARRLEIEALAVLGLVDDVGDLVRVDESVKSISVRATWVTGMPRCQTTCSGRNERETSIAIPGRGRRGRGTTTSINGAGRRPTFHSSVDDRPASPASSPHANTAAIQRASRESPTCPTA